MTLTQKSEEQKPLGFFSRMTQSFFGGTAQETPAAHARDTKALDSVNGSGKASTAQMNVSFDTNCSSSSPRKMQVDGASTTLSGSTTEKNVLDELATYWEEKDAADILNKQAGHQMAGIMARQEHDLMLQLNTGTGKRKGAFCIGI